MPKWRREIQSWTILSRMVEPSPHTTSKLEAKKWAIPKSVGQEKIREKKRKHTSAIVTWRWSRTLKECCSSLLLFQQIITNFLAWKHTDLFLEFWRSEVSLAKVMLAGLFLLEALVFLLFPASRNQLHCLGLWPLPPSSDLVAQHLQTFGSYSYFHDQFSSSDSHPLASLL